MQGLFIELFTAGTETELQQVIDNRQSLFGNPDNWKHLGGQENNFAIIKNQQSSPIAALVEKVTNAIDAILMKKCYESGIDPQGADAPRTMDEAVARFFSDCKNWDIPKTRKSQSEEIQIIADGRPRDTSVIIYDNGEGQHPQDMESTFLSLIRGNKNKIHFVQGKYNMGGSGAIVFSGKHGYQLIGSKRYTNDGNFGFTLIRQHPMSDNDKQVLKETWFEYMIIDGKIPSFPIKKLDLNLLNRSFVTGSIIKLYSYQFPSGYSGFAQDLNQSLNEFLFKPLLPLYTIDTKERYPNNRILENDLFGLWRKLDQDKGEYIEGSPIVEVFEDELFGKGGKITVTSYIFATRNKDKDAKQTREDIDRNFFKNEMGVLFSLNGQVHGYYRREFFSRAGLSLLKDHLLVHVDCTEIGYDFRKELFMASRDRLKDGEQTQQLREFLRKKLGSADSQLKQIEKQRKDSITAGGADTAKVIQEFTKKLPMNSEMLKLLNATFKLDVPQEVKKKPGTTTMDTKPAPEPFVGKRFPSFLKLKAKQDGEIATTKVPLGGNSTLRLETDVENNYFNRTEESGELKLELLDYAPNETTGGTGPGAPSTVADVFNIHKVSPQDGVIKVNLGPKENVAVGDRIQIKATLSAPDGDIDALFWVKISEKEPPKPEKPKEETVDPDQMGLPEFKLVYREKKDEHASWEDMQTLGKPMDWDTIIVPIAEGDILETIYINMDSKVLKNFKSKEKHNNLKQLEFADRKYSTSVYFHTLFLYSITRNRKYRISQEGENNSKDIAIEDYLQSLFQSYYAEFILNFGGAEEMMAGLGEN